MLNALGATAGAVYFILLGTTFAVHFDRPLQDEEVSASQNDEFDDYILKHGLTYKKNSDEYFMRREILVRRSAEVNAQNARPDALWVAGLNAFSDRTDIERRAFRGWRGPFFEKKNLIRFAEPSSYDNGTLPASFDWKHLQTTNPIKDQGACGSCWAVTTITVLEANYEIHNKKAVTFSAQELVSCVENPRKCGGDGGCQGATVELGMQYIMENGLSTEAEVPYAAADMSCSSAKATTKTTTDIIYVMLKDDPTKDPPLRGTAGEGGQRLGLSHWETLPTNREAPLVQALVQQGPVAVSVAADAWMEYSSGIFNNCPKDCVVDHAVSLYGYGTNGTLKYWLIRNSWGNSWGEQGFIRLLRHDDEDSWCGIDNDPAKGLACEGGPSQVTVCGTCGVLYDSVIPYFVHNGATRSFAEADRNITKVSMSNISRVEQRLMRREK